MEHSFHRIEKGVSMPDVLLAEDNPADVYLIREALREHGVRCTLEVISTGEEVLRIVSGEGNLARPLDLVILDLNLPRHDGIEILQRLRESATLSHVPVVVLTSSDSPRDRKAAMELGATRFLRKPSSLEEFLDLGLIFRNLLTNAGSAGPS